jgi:hypothetical protein
MLHRQPFQPCAVRRGRLCASVARPLLARVCGLLGFAALVVAVAGAVLAPVSLVPQLAFASAVVLLLGACGLDGGQS